MALSMRSVLTGGLAYIGTFFSLNPRTEYAKTADIEPDVSLSDSASGSCPINGPLSCHNSTATPNSCCFIFPSGRFLLTQFWDTIVHAGGADEDWTLHGLWPDKCDGSYDQFCNMTPQFHNVTAILASHGQQKLTDFMNRYWLAAYGANSQLWAHEFNKHATCINTLAKACYTSSYLPGLQVVDYFARATALFRTLDTYTALSLKDIVPSHRKHYRLVDVQAALEEFAGGKVVLRCVGPARRDLHEVWYVYFVRGSLQTGEFLPAQESAKEKNAGNCAPWVRYVPKRRAGHKGVEGGGDMVLREDDL